MDLGLFWRLLFIFLSLSLINREHLLTKLLDVLRCLRKKLVLNLKFIRRIIAILLKGLEFGLWDLILRGVSCQEGDRGSGNAVLLPDCFLFEVQQLVGFLLVVHNL